MYIFLRICTRQIKNVILRNKLFHYNKIKHFQSFISLPKSRPKIFRINTPSKALKFTWKLISSAYRIDHSVQPRFSFHFLAIRRVHHQRELLSVSRAAIAEYALITRVCQFLGQTRRQANGPVASSLIHSSP